MTKEEKNSLRKRAEARLGFASDDISSMSKDDIQQTLQELHTHQIELEKQCEELRFSQINLEESRKEYSDLYDFAPTGYFTLNEKGLIIKANLTTSTILGVKRNFLLKQPFSAFIFSEDQDIFYKHKKELVEKKGKRTCELRLQKKEGGVLYVQLESIVIPDIDGDTGQYRTTITDVSARKQLERQLKASEALHRITIESISDPVFITDEAGLFTFICPNIPHILGFSVAEVERMGNISVFFGENFFDLDDLKEQREINNIEAVIADKNGRKRDYLVTVKRVSIEKGSILYVCREITELKQIGEQQAKLRLQIETLWEISQMIDDDLKSICDNVLIESTRLTQSQYGFYGFLNEESMSIYSWSKNAMKDCNIHDKPLEFCIKKSGIWGNAIRDKKPFLLNDYQLNCPNKKGLPEGHVSLTRVLSVPVIVSGRVVAVCAVANKSNDYIQNDVTALQTFLNNIQLIIEKKKDQAALRKANDELEQRVEERTKELQITHKQLLHSEKLSAIGRLSASIAHEFNNPLQGVINIIKGIKHRATMDEEDAQLVDSAIIECDRMKNLIKSLQDFNRPSTGRMAPMNIHSAIDSILMLSKKDYQTRGITIETNYADLPQVKAVADQIKQVLLNLLNNAVYACSRGDTITISTDVINKEGIRIKIQDTGKGIKPEHINKIFDPFFTTKPAIKGTGLGLSISYGIIKKHGGRIEVKSEPDKGTIFTITLPNTRVNREK